MKRFIKALLLTIGVVLIAYAIATPGDQLWQAFLGGIALPASMLIEGK
jgi:hypothetical protein